MHMMRLTLSILNSKKKYVISTLLVLVSVAAGVWFLNRVFMRNGSRFKYTPFYENDTEYDAFFLGTSHVINGIFPMQLWEDYGITSYNFGGHGNSIATSYWVLVNACKYHKPKVAILDVHGVHWKSMNVSQAHTSMDSVPVSFDKITAAGEIFPDNKQSRNEIIMPVSVYHNRWTELSKEMLLAGFGIYNSTKEMGAESRIAVAVPNEMDLIDQSEISEEDMSAMAYIEKFIDYCRSEGIEPVLINIPFPTDETTQRAANTAIKLGRDVNVPGINFQYEDIVDFDIDCYDKDSHLNPSGARKVTDYLGKFLSENYDLKDKRDYADYQNWNDYYDEYKEYINNNIRNCTDYKTALMLLNNENYRAELRYTKDHSIKRAGRVEEKLIKQLGDNISCIFVPNIFTEDGAAADIEIDIYDAKSGDRICTKYYKTDETDVLVKNLT